MAFHYIRESGIKKLVKENGKRCGRDFLREFDEFVYNKVHRAMQHFNGHRKTLDNTIAKHVLGE